MDEFLGRFFMFLLRSGFWLKKTLDSRIRYHFPTIDSLSSSLQEKKNNSHRGWNFRHRRKFN
jgi:hypothetical protein